MDSIFLYPKSIRGECFQSKIRIINKLNISSNDLNPNEIVINIDRDNNQTLVGKPVFKITKYEGKLYEKFVNLSLPHEGKLTSKYKKRIIEFICKLGCPVGPIGLTSENVNWLFIPYTINLNQGEGDFFSSFRNFYVDFVEIIEIIKSDNLVLLNQYQGEFNNGLSGNRLYLPPFDNGFPIKWIGENCLNLCYLEVYELLLSNQKIKTCKYCNDSFESSKQNRVRCNSCIKNSGTFRKLYHQRNLQIEREKAKLRMRKIREKNKLLTK